MSNETRKGLMTPDQEKILDKVIKFKNKLAEAADGPTIRVVDNQLFDRLMDKLKEKHPGAEEIVYEIVDVAFEALGPLAEAAE
jgi:hypothetical protein